MTDHILYILSGERRGPVFIGVAQDLTTSLRRHRAGKSARPEFRLDRLVYTERFDCRFKADLRRRALKSTSRSWLEALISSQNPAWQDLSAPTIEIAKAA